MRRQGDPRMSVWEEEIIIIIIIIIITLRAKQPKLRHRVL